MPHLAAPHRAVLPDHLGFGLSDNPTNLAYSLMEQADVAQDVWRALGIQTGPLIAHDYRTGVVTELVGSLTSPNGSVHLDLARPWPRPSGRGRGHRAPSPRDARRDLAMSPRHGPCEHRAP